MVYNLNKFTGEPLMPKRNVPALVLGISYAVTAFLAMFLPLWVVTTTTYTYYGNYIIDQTKFTTFSIPSMTADYMYAEFQWVGPFVIFLICLIFGSMALVVTSSAFVFSGNRRMKGMGIAGSIIGMFCFFVLMIVGFVAAPTYTYVGSNYTNVGIAWSEFPFICIVGVSIPYLIMLNKRSFYNMYTDYSAHSTSVSVKPSVKKEVSVSAADELKKFKDLLDSGAITKEEYEQQKKKILNL